MRVVAQDFVGNTLGGSPLPFGRKIWIDLGGKPYIWHIVERLKRCKKIDEIFLFAQDTEEHEEIVDLCHLWSLNFRFLGKSWDWQGFLNWNKQLKAEIVIPNIIYFPLIDPEELDSRIEYFISNKLDYLESKDNPPFIIINSKTWQRLHELEKNFEVFRGAWPDMVKKRSDLFKSDTFGTLNKKFLDKSIQGVPLVKKIYEKFYQPPEIVDLDKVISFYEQKPEWFEFLSEAQLEIEVTNDCDLKCIMCPRTSKMSRGVGYMDFDLFKKIIDETETLSIHFSGFGEPLLHPQIKEMCAYAKEQRGLEVGLWTNGLNLDEGISRDIIKKGLVDYIIFGLDVARAETYLKVKGVDVFDKVVKNITGFLELKKEFLRDKPKYYTARKPLVGVQIIKMKENDAEIEQFMEEWDFQEKAKKIIDYPKRIEREASKVTAELWETLYDKFLPVEHAVIGHFNSYCSQIMGKTVLDVTPLKRFPCRQLKEGISVFWNGEVVLCRQDFNGEFVFGNLKNETLSDILGGQRFEEICRIHREGKYEELCLCKDCEDWYYNLYG